MPDQTSGVRFGANLWNQYTDWPAWLEAARLVDQLGFDSLWTWDHLYPIVGSDDGPIYEAYTTLGAWAMATERVKLGLMVGANTFRNPALVAKMVTTLDHISGGRMYCGIGAAWFETEHTAFGLEFNDAPERLRKLGEALPIIRGMLDGTEPSAAGRYYQAASVRNDPLPLQAHLPILIGGGGEKVTLKLVAKYGDANNVGGDLETIKRKDAILRQHCEDVGRDESEIERTTELGVCVIRDSREEAQRVFEQIFETQGRAGYWTRQPVGTPEDIVEFIEPYLEIGYRHLMPAFPAPHDQESMTRLIQEVKPKLKG
ncbi:MAG: TIGR03560 family F420-dependent LLM class oxidoreductase [Chloroflexi bacterium]|nr:TIGR03560 family F420-dependent LLM class oxidoreductase [Chloroflexota bacterium]